MNSIGFLLYLLLALMPLGQLVSVSVVSPSIRLYPSDLVVAVLGFTLLLVGNKNYPDQTKKLLPYFGAFILIAGLSLLVNIPRYPMDQLLVSSFYLVRWTLLVGIYLTTSLYVKKYGAYQIMKVFLGASCITALVGLIQYVLYPNLRNLMYAGWDPHEYRVFAPFLDSGFTGILLVIPLLYISTRILFHNNYKPLTIISGLLLYTTLALTYSRSSFLALLTGFMVFSIVKRSVKPIIYITLILSLTIVLLPRPTPTSEGTRLERTASVVSRFENYTEAFSIIRDHPILGVGFNTLRYEKIKRGLIPEQDEEVNHAAAGFDSSLLFITATTGIIGLSVYFLLWRRILVSSFNQLKKTESVQTVGLIASISALFIHSLFLNSLFYPWVLVCFWILLGVVDGSFDARDISRPILSSYFKRIVSFVKGDR